MVLMASMLACTSNQEKEIEHGTWLKGDKEHFVEAIEKGFERRPARKANSLDFLGAPTDILQQAIDAKSLEHFNQAFIMFNAACQSCHLKEEVAFIKTIIPKKRLGHTRFQ